METLSGILLIPILLLMLVLAILAFLMPYFIWQIAKHSKSAVDKANEISALMRELPSAKFASDSIEEARKNNALLRQLIRAYGHDPEA